MKTRINTKFVLILIVTVFASAVVLGGLLVLHRHGDLQRHIRTGDQLMAQGEYERAMRAYGRAVDKDPANLEYLRLVENAILQIRPQAQDKAAELYSRRLGVFQHEIRYHPQNAEAHLKYLRALFKMARFIN